MEQSAPRPGYPEYNMPNGWYPVEGLDVVLLHRTEQRYPRFNWDAAYSKLWAVRFGGPRGYAPVPELQYSPGPGTQPFEELVKAASSVCARDSMQGTASASAVYVDFDKRQGAACGVFCVYGFKGGTAQVLLDRTLGSYFPPEQRAAIDPQHIGIQTTAINESGLFPASVTMESCQFSFADSDALVVSSEPLHYDPHWPPKNSLDCMAILLAQPRQQDTLIALWREEAPPPQK